MAGLLLLLGAGVFLGGSEAQATLNQQKEEAEDNIAEFKKEIKKLEADLVIMGAHRHGALYNLFVGSVASEVMKRMTFPLLLVPGE